MIQQSAAGLLLDPGLGKTSCTLAAFKILRDMGYVKRMLVIAPLRPMYSVWPAETEKWNNFQELNCSILHGSDKDWQAANPDGVDIFLINPEGLGWLLNSPKRLKKLGVDMLVVDESTKFKHPNTARFKLLRKFLPKFARRYILTGTISPNGLMDLFGQIYILDGGHALGSYITHFRTMYFSQPNPQYEPYLWAANKDAVDRIAKKLSPLCLQLNAEDYLEMPDLQYIDIEVELPSDARDRYTDVEADFITQVGEDFVVAENAAVAGTKCRQIANGAVYTGKDEYAVVHAAKLDALEELVEELSGAPLLVLYEYRHDLERIQTRFKTASVLGSGVSQRKAHESILRFNAGDIPILLGHPASMGHGLNLQGACHHVCWFGITWNFEYYDQTIARVYRQGQESEVVFVYHLVAKGTLDEKVLRVLDDKERTQQTLMDALVAPL